MRKLVWSRSAYYTAATLLGVLITVGGFWLTLPAGEEAGETAVGEAILAVLAVGVLSAPVVGVVFSLNLEAPLRRRLSRLHHALEALVRGSVPAPLTPHSRTDEFARVEAAFNRLLQEWQEQVQTLHQQADERQRLAEELSTSAVEQERRRLARDLHDAISQRLFAMGMNSATLPRLLEKDPQQAGRLAAELEELAAQAQLEMRALLLQLRPEGLEGLSLEEGFRRLLERLAAQQPVQLAWRLDPVSVSPGVADQLFRVGQEALANSLRHAAAHRVEVRLRAHPDHVVLTVEDDGVGFDLHTDVSPGSYGLRSMRERAEKLGGHLDVVTVSGHGTRIQVRVPIQALDGKES